MEYLNETKARMPVPDRAKQFSAFDALSGLYTALSEEEKKLAKTRPEDAAEEEEAPERDRFFPRRL